MRNSVAAVGMVITAGAGLVYGSMLSFAGIQTAERGRCSQLLSQQAQAMPDYGAGWEVIVKVPGAKMPSQKLCKDPELNMGRRQVICYTDIIGMGDPRKQDYMRRASR